MRCKCGFEAPIWKWDRVEISGVTGVPEKAIARYEEFVDGREVPELVKALAKTIFRRMGESGMMPCHVTEYMCPRCGVRAKTETQAQGAKLYR